MPNRWVDVVGRGPSLGGDFFIEEDPTTTYLSTNTGNPLGMTWVDGTQTGGGTTVVYDTGSPEFVLVVGHDITVFSDDDSPEGAYTSLSWSPDLAVGSVLIEVEFLDEFLSTIDTFSDTNFSPSSGGVFFPYSVDVPAGGSITVHVTHTGTPTTFTIDGELAFRWSG